MEKSVLEKLYLHKGLSSAEIACQLKCSTTRVDYWLKKHEIPKRSISDAIYKKRNPKGDPFLFSYPKGREDSILYGIGLGLYWGEGNKKSKTSVRLGNSDPKVIKKFIEFLEIIYKIDSSKLRFGLQIFNDMPQDKAVSFWKKYLGIRSNQLQKVVVTPARGEGTYTRKTKYGVMTVYFNNVKLRNHLINTIEKL